ncbi:MAG: AAA family ATPase [Thermoplasmatales archaeon]|nr:MAG: AAA family ATPase [Thermoplasmatales archaeon]
MVIITISGTPGSGKSTIAQLLHKRLNLRYVYSGLIFRETAEKYNMTLEEFGKYCEENSNIDKELDEKQVEILKKDDVILEGRIAGWLAFKNNISAFKIMINADIDTRAKRIVNREKGNVDKRKKEILERERSESARYKKYYNIDLIDSSIYDLVIDSSDKTPEEIIEIIMKKIDG